MARMTEADIAERDTYRAELRELLTPGQTIYTRDGASGGRGSTVYVRLYIVHNGDIRDITYSAAMAMGERITYARGQYPGDGGISFGGWGYSKEFQAVYSLGRALYPDGVRCAGNLKSRPKCYSNDHTNGDPKGYSRAKGHVHGDGGYTFRQESL